jgi:hypothetical protein
MKRIKAELCDGPVPLLASKPVSRLARLGLWGLLLAGIWAAPALAAPVTPPRVLILAPSSETGALAQETLIAQGLGFIVDSVSAATWSGMTPTGGGPGGLGFGSYRAIILCDNECQVSPSPVAAAVANNTVWSPVITGNVIVDGEDFTYHANASQIGAKNFITNAILFATAQPSNPGLFVQLSCYYSTAAAGTLVPVLNQLSSPANQTGPSPNGPFSVQGGAFEKIHLTAASPALAGLTDANLSSYSASSHETFYTWPKDFIVLAIATDSAPLYSGGVPVLAGSPYIMVRGSNITVLGNTCVSLTNELVTCVNSNQTYLWNFCVTNNFTNEIQYLTIPNPPPGVTFSEDIIKLPVDLLPGQGTCVSLYVTNQSTNNNVCFEMGAHNTNLFLCCSFSNCLTFAPCCAYVTNETLRALPRSPNCYTYTVTIENTTASTIQYVFLIPDASACISFNKDIITLPTPLAPNQSETFSTTVCLTASSNCPAPYCFLISLANSNLVQCCSSSHCLTPSKGPIAIATPADGSYFLTPVSIPLAVSQSGEIAFSSVTYLANGLAVASSSAPPFSTVWSNAPDGQYALTAAGVETNAGDVWTSDPVSITVGTDQPDSTANPAVLASPANNSVFAAPTNIPLSVTLSTNYTFTSVTYLANGQPIASNSAPPFSATWFNPQAGLYGLIAAAQDTLGDTWLSLPVSTTVFGSTNGLAVAPVLTSLQCVNNGLNFCVSTIAGTNYYVETATSLKSPVWTVVQTIVGNGSTVTVTNRIGTAPQQFYRVRIGQ